MQPLAHVTPMMHSCVDMLARGAPPMAKAAAAAAVAAAARTAGAPGIPVHARQNYIDAMVRGAPPITKAAAAAAVTTATGIPLHARQTYMNAMVRGAPTSSQATATDNTERAVIAAGVPTAPSTTTGAATRWARIAASYDGAAAAKAAEAAEVTANHRQNHIDGIVRRAPPGAEAAASAAILATATNAEVPTRSLTTGTHLPAGISSAARIATDAVPYAPSSILPTWTMCDIYGAPVPAVQTPAQDMPSTQVAHDTMMINRACDSLYSCPDAIKSTRSTPWTHPIKILPW